MYFSGRKKSTIFDSIFREGDTNWLTLAIDVAVLDMVEDGGVAMHTNTLA